VRRLALVLPWLLLVGGCVYYNGMYNTKSLAKRARNAEREGRTFEASNLWGQVSVKAETLLVAHPRSKYAEEARLLYGTARAKLNDCSTALPELETVMLGARNATFAEAAAEMVGWCRVALGDLASAAEVYARLTTSKDPARRDLALYAHGQALRLSGQYREALIALGDSKHGRARGERAAALAGAGDTAGARAVIDSLIAERDSLAPWPDIVALVGATDLETGTALTDRLAAWPALPATTRGQLLIEDAVRISAVDVDRAQRRLAAVQTVAEGTERAIEARLLLIRWRIARAETPDSLAAIANDLMEMRESASSFIPVVQQLSVQAQRAAEAADSVPPGSPGGELRLFLAGELARDSLDARRFAAAQFRRIVEQWPESPFAPKALLALIVMQPHLADSLQARMRASYQSSPYLVVADGGESAQLAVLEDSLRQFVTTYQTGRTAPRGTPARPGARPNRPSTPMEPQ
jgi:hypothetical protein